MGLTARPNAATGIRLRLHVSKYVRHRDFEPIHDLLQGVDGHILIPQLDAVQGGSGNAPAILKLSKCRLSSGVIEE